MKTLVWFNPKFISMGSAAIFVSQVSPVFLSETSPLCFSIVVQNYKFNLFYNNMQLKCKYKILHSEDRAS